MKCFLKLVEEGKRKQFYFASLNYIADLSYTLDSLLDLNLNLIFYIL
jgi:hypothetical protein